MKKRAFVLTISGVAFTAALALTGCGAVSTPGSGTNSTESAATGQPAPSVKNVKDIKMAFFSAGTSNQYLQAGIDALKGFANKQGFTLDVFDGKFDAQTQYNQMQTAITSGKYNSFVVEANDGNLVCNMLTKDAPAAGIMVSIINIQICGRETSLGEETWQPGTVTFVGGQTLDIYQKWIDQVKKDHPDGAKIALIEGPQLNSNSKNFDKSIEAGFTGKWQVVAKQYTDYTTAQAFAAAQTIVQSHPDLNVVMSNYSGMSQGVIQATGGKNITVYDFGADQWSFGAVKSGQLKSTVVMLPKEESVTAAQAIVDLVGGKTPQKFYNLTQDPSLGGKSPFIYKDTIDQYTPEY